MFALFLLVFVLAILSMGWIRKNIAISVAATRAWLQTLVRHPVLALRILWKSFWASWQPPLTLAVVLISFISYPSLLGYNTTKLAFLAAMILIFVRASVAEEIHGKKQERRETKTRVWEMVMVLVVLGIASFLMCGALENSRRGKDASWSNIWAASLWWHHETSMQRAANTNEVNGPQSTNASKGTAALKRGKPKPRLAPPAPSASSTAKVCRDDKLADCSFPELRKRALALAAKIQELADDSKKRVDRADREEEDRRNDSPSAYQEWKRETTNAVVFFERSNVSSYNKNFKDKAIIYRDEMVTRLGPSVVDAYSLVDYERPVAWFQLRDIARDLTRLAGMLATPPS